MNSNNLKLAKTETSYEKACNFPISERNACEFSPCENGGRCEMVNATFFCQCPFGYMGDRCETGKLCYKVILRFFMNFSAESDMNKIYFMITFQM